MQENILDTKVTYHWPVWRHDQRFIVTVNNVLGATAMWAVQQSPYNCPENLPEALADLREYLINYWVDDVLPCSAEFQNSQYKKVNIRELHSMLTEAYLDVPSIKIWNSPKVPKSQFMFDESMVYSQDNDFIDLEELARNASHTIGLEEIYFKDQKGYNKFINGEG